MQNITTQAIQTSDILSSFFPTSELIKIFITSFGPIFLYFTLAYIVFFLIFKKRTPLFSPVTIFNTIKLVVSGVIVLFVFFYDINIKSFTLEIPDKMLFSTFLVGLLALYEVISCFLAILNNLLSPLNKS